MTQSALTAPRVLDVASLGEAQRREMFALYERYYEAAHYAQFCADLDAKHKVIALHDVDGALRGFTTLAVYTREFAGTQVRVLFSGDTIVDESHWGQQSLAFAWVRLAAELRAQRPDVPHYWFLISKGHRTYRYLAAFSLEFLPAPERTASAHERALRDFLARDRFGASYDATSGTIRFAASRGHLRPQYAQIPAAHLRLPEVAFFLQHNPGYVHGDELACLCRLDADNLRPIARRAFLAATKRIDCVVPQSVTAAAAL
jgi:hypothetical protein